MTTRSGAIVAALAILAIVLAVGAIAAGPAAAQETDQPIPTPPDSLVLPAYSTSYDRDRTREAWGQDLGYSFKKKRSSFDLTGSVDTQNFLTSPSKSTRGSINGTLIYNLVGTWQLVLLGAYDMNSSTDGPSNLESRDNRLNLQTQYLFYPVRQMMTKLTLSSEFEQKHDRNRNDRVDQALFDPGAVDTSVAQRDSSYTSARKDAFSADIQWPAARWLDLHQTVVAYQSRPTITSFQRSFVNPLDGTAGGRTTEELQRTSNPSGNTLFTTSAAISRRMSKIVLTGSTSSLRQSYFDKQRSRQENSRFDNNLANYTLDMPVRRSLYLHSEGAISRNLNQYDLNRTQTTLTHDKRALALLSYIDSTFSGNVNFNLDRTKTELQPSINGVEVDRALGGLFKWRRSRKLVLDGNGSVTFRGNDYQNDRIDRDNVNTFFSVGGGYMLTPACSTTVHFSRGWKHAVALDPSQSGSNAVTTTYQMNATLVYLPTRNFSLRQQYLLSAEYRILDYVESQNSLVRARRIDTDVADTLFSFGIVRLTHNFVFQDQGTYARFNEAASRQYRVATRSYDQTVTATVGAKLAPGVVVLATQSLLNRRAEALAFKRRTLQNTFKLNLSLQVSRTLSDGLEINGAVRKLGEYVEGKLNSKDTTRDDWVAGVTIRKAF